MKTFLTFAFVLLVGFGLSAAQERLEVLSIDPEDSRVVIEVGRAGLFGFVGHTHEVIAPALNGEIRFDEREPAQSSVRVEFDASALEVTGKGEPAEDVPEVQQIMLSDRVLDVERYPTIVFESRAMVVREKTAETLTLLVAGDLTLHGITRRVTVRVTVRAEPDHVAAEGRGEIKQTDFEIEPIRAAGGTVKVKDEVRVIFSLSAPR